MHDPYEDCNENQQEEEHKDSITDYEEAICSITEEVMTSGDEECSHSSDSPS